MLSISSYFIQCPSFFPSLSISLTLSHLHPCQKNAERRRRRKLLRFSCFESERKERIEERERETSGSFNPSSPSAKHSFRFPFIFSLPLYSSSSFSIISLSLSHPHIPLLNFSSHSPSWNFSFTCNAIEKFNRKSLVNGIEKRKEEGKRNKDREREIGIQRKTEKERWEKLLLSISSLMRRTHPSFNLLPFSSRTFISQGLSQLLFSFISIYLFPFCYHF